MAMKSCLGDDFKNVCFVKHDYNLLINAIWRYQKFTFWPLLVTKIVEIFLKNIR